MKYYLREATEDDAELLFEWVNEEAVRRNSFTTRKISHDEHMKWMNRILTEPDCHQYIYVCEGECTGQIRIRMDGENGEISYSICARKRGQGHGKRLLQLACEKVKQDFPGIKKLTGQVKPDNIASQMAFQGMGFQKKAYVYEVSLDSAK